MITQKVLMIPIVLFLFAFEAKPQKIDDSSVKNLQKETLVQSFPGKNVLAAKVKPILRRNIVSDQWALGLGVLSYAGNILLVSSDSRQSEVLVQNNSIYFQLEYKKNISKNSIKFGLLTGWNQARAEKNNGNIDYSYSDAKNIYLGLNTTYSENLNSSAEVNIGVTGLYNKIDLPLPQTSTTKYQFAYKGINIPLYLSVGPTWKLSKSTQFEQKLMLPLATDMSSAWSLQFVHYLN